MASPLDDYTAAGIYDPAKQFRGRNTGNPSDPLIKSDPSNMPDPLLELLKMITGGGDSAKPAPIGPVPASPMQPQTNRAPMDLTDYIRQAAAARGIDPDIALKVAKGEGGLSDPFRHGEGPAPRSQAAGLGATENSYGPFQLYVSGTGAGLGDRALAAGIDPSKDWQRGVDFALDEAKNKGWGQWYGAKAQGITGMAGIGGAPAQSPYAGMADGPKGQEAFPAPILGPSGPTQQAILGDPSIPQDVANYAAADEPKTLGERLHGAFKALATNPNASPVRFGQMGDARQSGNDLLEFMAGPQIASGFLAKRSYE